jgi:1,4-alpha-glucan branching enzyme
MRRVTSRQVFLVLITLVVASSCAYLGRRTHRGPTLEDNEVLFRYYAPTARRVQLAGDWQGNNWARGDGSAGEANIGLMEDRDGDGVWEIQVALPPGRYRYVFLVDENTWHTDPGNPEEVEGGPVQRCSQIVLHTKNNRLEIR